MPTDPFHSTLPFIQKIRPRGAFRDHIYRLIPSLWSYRNPWGGKKHIWTLASDIVQTPDYKSKWQIIHPVENVREIYEARKKERKKASYTEWHCNLAIDFKQQRIHKRIWPPGHSELHGDHVGAWLKRKEEESPSLVTTHVPWHSRIPQWTRGWTD